MFYKLSYLILLLILLLGGCSKEFSNPIDTESSDAVPPTPLDLKVFPEENINKVRGSFSYKYQNASGILWERQIPGSQWLIIDSVSAGSTFVDSGLDWATQYHYRIAGYNLNGLSNYSNITAVTTANSPDLIGPVINMINPQSDSIFIGYDSLLIEMEITDPSGVGLVTLNEDTVAYDLTSGRFLYTVNLSRGNNSFTIIANDAYDNVTSLTFNSVIYEPTLFDFEIPLLSNIKLDGSPFFNDTASVEDVQVQLSGQYSDISGIKSIIVNDSAAAVTDSLWNVTLNLQNNIYTPIIITATDNSINANTVTDTLYSIVRTDLTRPIVTVTSHTDSAIVAVDSLVLTGTAKDVSGISSVLVLGRLATITDDTTWTATIKGLSQGFFTQIVIDVRDNSNNANLNSSEIYIKYDPTLLDNNPPVTTVISHSADGTDKTGTVAINISGVARDESGIAGVSVNGQVAAISDDSLWTAADIAIKPGHNSSTEISVITTDKSIWANKDTLIFNVTYDSSLTDASDVTPPLITLQHDYYQIGDTIIVRDSTHLDLKLHGTIFDDAGISTFTINSSDIAIDPVTFEWSYQVNLTQYTSILPISATDASDNSNVRNSNIFVKYDYANNAPTIRIQPQSNRFEVTWSTNGDPDFQSYNLWISEDLEISTSSTPLFTSESHNDTSYLYDVADLNKPYMIKVAYLDSAGNYIVSSATRVYNNQPTGMKFIPGGTFTMGSDDETYVYAQPAHTVTVSSFWMDSTEVTQAEYESLMDFTVYPYDQGHNNNAPLWVWSTAYENGDNYPAYHTSMTEAALFCNARSKRDGYDTVYTFTDITVLNQGTSSTTITLENFSINMQVVGYRLPTEAEWAYAAKGGSDHDYFWGDNSPSDYAWCDLSSFDFFEVAQKLPNSFGLYDMIGNVSEWTNDKYSATYYSESPLNDPTGPTEGGSNVIRGGPSANSCLNMTIWKRAWSSFQKRGEQTGFRCVIR